MDRKVAPMEEAHMDNVATTRGVMTSTVTTKEAAVSEATTSRAMINGIMIKAATTNEASVQIQMDRTAPHLQATHQEELLNMTTAEEDTADTEAVAPTASRATDNPNCHKTTTEVFGTHIVVDHRPLDRNLAGKTPPGLRHHR